MSQKGISICYDSYLRLLENPVKFNLKHNYIQGKLTVTKAVQSKGAPIRMNEAAVVEDLVSDTEELLDDSNSAEVSKIPFVSDIVMFVDIEAFQNWDADITINTPAPEKPNAHALVAAKTVYASIKNQINSCNKVFNFAIHLDVLDHCFHDFSKPLKDLNVFGILKDIAIAIEFVFVNKCKMKNVKSNKLFEKLHQALKNARHNALSKKY
jgi:hypothetical protein